jgi:hypothetical protein
MRIGIISPNLLLNNYANRADIADDFPWEIDSLGKKAALLFDKLYLTHDLETTCTMIGSVSGEFESDPRNVTLRYLIAKGLIVTPEDLGFASGGEFIEANLKGVAAKLHTQLLRVGNPTYNADDDFQLIGQPDVGDFVAHDGWHPRTRLQQHNYESLLLRRNAALLREAIAAETPIVARLFEEPWTRDLSHPVWRVVLTEMPALDTKAPWEDVLSFRAEKRTQHLIRKLRLWIRKTVAEEWSPSELEDEVRELVYEYGNHLGIARLSGGRGIWEFLITGAAELVEDVVKLRFGKIAKLATAMIDRKVRFLEEEAKAPGRELALIPEMKQRF